MSEDESWLVRDESEVREFLKGAGEDVIERVLDERELESLRFGYRERVTDMHLPHVRELPRAVADFRRGVELAPSNFEMRKALADLIAQEAPLESLAHFEILAGARFDRSDFLADIIQLRLKVLATADVIFGS